jgi:hypothetical protein
MGTTVSATERISIDNDAVVVSNGNAIFESVVTPDGRYIVFITDASSLAGETNDIANVFVKDMINGTIERISIANNGDIPNDDSKEVDISDDGRYVVFQSDATNLVPNDTNGYSDVFLYDRKMHSIKCVSENGDKWSSEPDISGNGEIVVFETEATNLTPDGDTAPHGGIHIYDVENKKIVHVIRANSSAPYPNNFSRYPHITTDSRYVIFNSYAENLVDEDETDGESEPDLFRFDTITGDIKRIDVRASSYSSIPTQSSISDDGRYVVFSSTIDGMVLEDSNGKEDVFIYDVSTDTLSLILPNSTKSNYDPVISADGNFISYILITPVNENTNNYDAYLYDRVNNTHLLISKNSAGEHFDKSTWNANVSADGSFVTLNTRSSNITPYDTYNNRDVYLLNRTSSSVQLVSGHTPSSNDSSGDIVSLSADGRYVAFSSKATNLIADDNNSKRDIFVKDRRTGFIERVSISSSGDEGSSDSDNPSISDDGRFVVFESFSAFISADTNAKIDIYLHDRLNHITQIISKNGATESNGHSTRASISATGRYVVFKSEADNLVSGDSNNKTDVFIKDLITDSIERVSVASDDSEANGAVNMSATVSADGRYVAFRSNSTSLSSVDLNGKPNIFLRDRTAHKTTCISVPYDGTLIDGYTYNPTISDDGSVIVFEARATNLVPDDTNGHNDIFVYSLATQQIKRVTDNSNDEHSYGTSMSADGRFISYRSGATGIVTDDSNGEYDAFIYDTKNNTTVRVNLNNSDEEATGGTTYNPAISADGSTVGYLSNAKNLVKGNNNNRGDIFVSDNPFKKSNISPALIMYLLN